MIKLIIEKNISDWNSHIRINNIDLLTRYD
jgi:hypothetical protein